MRFTLHQMNMTGINLFLKKHMQGAILLVAIIIVQHNTGNAQVSPPNYARLLQVPKQYTILRTAETIQIDGNDSETDWNRAQWTESFTDITTGATANSDHQAKCKMLWDADYLYVYALFQERDIWGSITQPDVAVFQDNAFEIFINPDGSNYNYFEFQINALETSADLFLPRPYRNGGRPLSSWDIKGLKKAVRINGTLNHPGDKDSSWSIELAIPFAALDIRKFMITEGTIWRMNFSRVQWQLDIANGGYTRKRDQASGRPVPEHYDVWSPQGLVNLHYPERWGYVQFANKAPQSGFLHTEAELLKLTLWKYYYLQQQYNIINRKYAAEMSYLEKLASGLPDTKVSGADVQMIANEKQFYIQGKLPGSNEYMTLDHKGEFRVQRQ